MTVRVLNRMVRIGLAILVLGLVLAVVAGLFERPFALWPYLRRVGFAVLLLAMTPYQLKVMREREARYGLDGVVPGSARRLTITLGLLVVAVGLGGALAFALGYHHGIGR